MTHRSTVTFWFCLPAKFSLPISFSCRFTILLAAITRLGRQRSSLRLAGLLVEVHILLRAIVLMACLKPRLTEMTNRQQPTIRLCALPTIEQGTCFIAARMTTAVWASLPMIWCPLVSMCPQARNVAPALLLLLLMASHPLHSALRCTETG